MGLVNLVANLSQKPSACRQLCCEDVKVRYLQLERFNDKLDLCHMELAVLSEPPDFLFRCECPSNLRDIASTPFEH